MKQMGSNRPCRPVSLDAATPVTWNATDWGVIDGSLRCGNVTCSNLGKGVQGSTCARASDPQTLSIHEARCTVRPHVTLCTPLGLVRVGLRTSACRMRRSGESRPKRSYHGSCSLTLSGWLADPRMGHWAPIPFLRARFWPQLRLVFVGAGACSVRRERFGACGNVRLDGAGRREHHPRRARVGRTCMPPRASKCHHVHAVHECSR